jgi:YesN/AraC family two-component response regulator
MVSILIIDDHPFIVQGCKRVLEDAGIELIFEANDIVNGYELYLSAPDSFSSRCASLS